MIARSTVSKPAIKWISVTSVLALSLLFPANGNACSRSEEWSEKTTYEQSKQVFRAHVTKVELGKSLGDDPDARLTFVQVHYDLKETLKGQPLPNGPVSTHNAYYGGCGMPITVGVDYLFFVEDFQKGIPKELVDGSAGMISIFGSFALPHSEKHADQHVAKFRVYQKP